MSVGYQRSIVICFSTEFPSVDWRCLLRKLCNPCPKDNNGVVTGTKVQSSCLMGYNSTLLLSKSGKRYFREPSKLNQGKIFKAVFLLGSWPFSILLRSPLCSCFFFFFLLSKDYSVSQPCASKSLPQALSLGSLT